MQELEENNRIVNSIDLFKKSGATRGILHARMGTIKDRKVKELTEADEIRRGGKNAQKNYTKIIIMTRIGMLLGHSHKARYWSMTSSGLEEASLQEMLRKVMKFQLSCLKFLKNEAVNVLHSIFQQIWKAHQRPQCWQRSVFIPIQKKGNSKECSTYHAIVLISLASKIILNILLAKFQQYMN